MKDAKLVTFTKCPDWLMYTDLSLYARVVYLALWSHYDPKGGDLTVRPSIKRIAWLAKIGTTSARLAVRELRDAGLLLIKGGAERDSGSNEYLLYEPSETEIRVLVERRRPSSLTSNDAKTRRSDQRSTSRGVPPTSGVAPPTSGVAPPYARRSRSKPIEEDPGTRPRNETHPRPAPGGGTPSEVGQSHSSAPPRSDISDLRHRLEAHKR
jgi:hypothetical protein